MLSTIAGLSLMVRKAILPRTVILADIMPYTASVSRGHAPGLPQRPTYLPLGHTLSILASTNNCGNAQDA